MEVVRAAKVPAMLGFNRRFDPNHAALQDEVRRGEVGKLEIIQMTSRGPSLPAISYLATSGGQLKDQTIHFFDLLRWITGDEAEEVYAIGAAMVDPRVAEVGDVDTSIVAIRMASGALCQIDSARRTGYGYDERIEVFGSNGNGGVPTAAGAGSFALCRRQGHRRWSSRRLVRKNRTKLLSDTRRLRRRRRERAQNPVHRSRMA